jgi:hypothetical protein
MSRAPAARGVHDAPPPARADAQGLFGDGARSAGLGRADRAGAAPSDARSTERGARRRAGGAACASAMATPICGSPSTPSDAGSSACLRHGPRGAARRAPRASSSSRRRGALASTCPISTSRSSAFAPRPSRSSCSTRPRSSARRRCRRRATLPRALARRRRLRGALRERGRARASISARTRTAPSPTPRSTCRCPYRFAPLVGLRLDLGRVQLGASLRGALAVDLRLDSEVRIRLRNNPLNGSTTVQVSGPSGWDPTTIALGARVALGLGVSAIGALEYAVYSAAPAPIADVRGRREPGDDARPAGGALPLAALPRHDLASPRPRAGAPPRRSRARPSPRASATRSRLRRCLRRPRSPATPTRPATSSPWAAAIASGASSASISSQI